jgi:hypothetical protein
MEATLQGLRNYYLDTAMAIPVAIDALGRSIEPVRQKQSANRFHIGGTAVSIPVRVADAAQGWALYFVSAAHAERHLLRHGEPFTVVDVGGARAVLVVMGIDYRSSDIGAYTEIAVALLVRPRRAPFAMPGMLFLGVTVSDEFNIAAARALWGYNKTLSRHMEVSYHQASTRFVVDREDAEALSISFPRFGTGRSAGIPCYTYGVADDRGRSPRKTLMKRSAKGEGAQVAGAVAITLGSGKHERCVCRLPASAAQPCVCILLRDLGLPKPPAANGWAEHMTAEIEMSTPADLR